MDYRAFATTGSGSGRTPMVLFTAQPLPPDDLGVTKDGYLSDVGTTAGMQVRAIDESAVSDSADVVPGQGNRFVAVEVCARNRGPRPWDATAGYLSLGAAGHTYFDAAPDVTYALDNRPWFYAANLAPGALSCGWVAARVPVTADLEYVFFLTGRQTAPVAFRTP